MLDQNLLRKEIEALIRGSVITISDDVKELMKNAYEKEDNITGKSMLATMIDNVEKAEKYKKPVCQSPGYPTVYISFGDKTLPGNIKEIIGESLVKATEDGLLRPSIVHPLTRENSGNNSGDGVPNFEFEYIPNQEFLEVIISFKGCGAELGNEVKIMTTPMLGKDLKGLKKFILETVINAGGKPCPPYGTGIGIGGQMDVAAKLSRKAISVRPWNDWNEDEIYGPLERELLEEINSLGIGAAGTGGKTSALAVKVAGAHTHTAIAPVAINFHCWVGRRGGIRIFPNGKVEKIF